MLTDSCRSSVQNETKTVVTVTEMARMVGLSRARFYQLVQAGVFPPPVYNVSNHRPVYVEDLQKICLEVRRRNCGINGQPVLFYSKGHRSMGQAKAASKAKPKPTTKGQYGDVLDGLRALGLVAVSASGRGGRRTTLPRWPRRVDRAPFRAVFLKSSGGTPAIMLSDNSDYRPS